MLRRWRWKQKDSASKAFGNTYAASLRRVQEPPKPSMKAELSFFCSTNIIFSIPRRSDAVVSFRIQPNEEGDDSHLEAKSNPIIKVRHLAPDATRSFKNFHTVPATVSFHSACSSCRSLRALPPTIPSARPLLTALASGVGGSIPKGSAPSARRPVVTSSTRVFALSSLEEFG